MSLISLTLNGEQGKFIGELTRHSVGTIPQSLSTQLLAQKTITLDLTEVSQVDTAGLAWLIFLVEQAEKGSCQLYFSNLPKRLEKLIELSGVNGILPVNIV